MPLGGIDTITVLYGKWYVAEHCFLVFAIEHLSHQGGVSRNANYLFEYHQKAVNTCHVMLETFGEHCTVPVPCP